MQSDSQALIQSFDTFWYMWANRQQGSATIDSLIPYFSTDITAIGTGAHEKGQNLQEVIKNFSSDFREIDSPIELHFTHKEAKVLAPTAGLVEAEGTVEIYLEADEKLSFSLRFTTIFVKHKEQWQISHNHVSIPYDGQGSGEAYPIDKIRARNERLEQLVEQRTAELQQTTDQLLLEKQRTTRLLHNILPITVADELMETGQVNPTVHEQVTVLFSDFVGFSRISEKIGADRLVEELNDLFSHFDDLVKAEGLEKIKTIGDSYMVVGGLPQPQQKHACRTIELGKNMLSYLQQRTHKHTIDWQMRIGIHSGSVVAGVVGSHKFTYDLWGDTVNIASRLEQSSSPGRINISAATYQLIKTNVSCQYRGKVTVKGGKEIEMYYVV